jgi:hypothetical protein
MTQSSTEPAFPAFPPGLWRRIVLQPGPGWIGAALEDDMHRFNLRLDHTGGRITAVYAKGLRTPWTACPGASELIARELAGEPLADVARRDPSQHCTHLLDLAIVCAAHAGDAEPLRFDMRVADRVDQRTTATLAENGAEKLRWRLEGTLIAGPEPFAGKDLRKLSQWKRELPAREAERATMLRRAVYISGGRQFAPPPSLHAADIGPRMGVCYNYQLPQAEQSTRSPDWRQDFSGSDREPLEGLDPELELSAMGKAG